MDKPNNENNDQDNNVFFYNNVEEDNISESKEPITFKEVLAIFWATITVLGPILLAGGFIFFLVILFITKLWWRS